jgi:multidrug efflux pump
MMSSRFVHERGHEGRLTRLVNRAFDAVRRRYERLLDAALTMRAAIVAVALLVSVAAWPLYSMSKRELAPWRTRATSACSWKRRPTRRSRAPTAPRARW